MKRDLRIVFMGTPEFAVGVLSTLVEAGKNIVGVITAPDRPSGRGRKLTGSAVKEYAVSQDIPVLQPTNLKNEDFLTELKALNANLHIVVAFRMLPKVVWAMPEYGTFNLHASLLPQYRGAAPINWAIINKESKTGVTTFFIDEKIDTGEIILKDEVQINRDETVGTLHDTLMEVGSNLVVKTVKAIAKGDVTTIPQPKNVSGETLDLKEAPKLTPENTYIDWNASMETIDAFVRGLNPYPGAWSYLIQGEDKQKVKIFNVAEILNTEEIFSDINISEEKVTGDVFVKGKRLFVKLTKEVLEILEIQLPGKRRMKTKDLLNGYSFDVSCKMFANPHSH
ncbi:methionyl-tRNA formyltransferase [Patiriisocius marinistellae]|uniref:Methionyl-tRNA formyltransferase n=1 Tax=Patiriisocius marinistellae TaxID=2494560 RepID=A0A5J4FVI7_9FLAO|nr:methionyl-tRNA formyltransferase [Patiriisocius marinistellae]GEQ86010.1 methionyl-tRNA formyltransferase [Patiriisocius marinistellae]